VLGLECLWFGGLGRPAFYQTGFAFCAVHV
jgi:hypothetical protein